MKSDRTIRKLLASRQTIEGAGVHLKRAFGYYEVPLFDPFLLFDDFRSDNPAYYLSGFPWHPHRGIETITYVIAGDVEHGDSLGNKGIISSGDVQWMTAGSGIIHQEMPKGAPDGRMGGFQLWANLPASSKMMPPRYRDVKSSDIPEFRQDNGALVKVICGRAGDMQGPVQDIVTDPEYLDVSVPPGSIFEHPTKPGHTVFAYVIEGNGYFGPESNEPAVNGTVVLFDDGDRVTVTTVEDPVRFLLVSGRPIGEPVAWQGPIVMNTQAELDVAFDEYQRGTFIRQG